MLLLDENISYRIVKALSLQFPGICHILALAVNGSTDYTVWETARAAGFTIVTFDADYMDLLNLKGFPPKIIWLRFGNCSNETMIRTLHHHKDTIHTFIKKENLGILEITDVIPVN